jgi:hypothetical protein
VIISGPFADQAKPRMVTLPNVRLLGAEIKIFLVDEAGFRGENAQRVWTRE